MKIFNFFLAIALCSFGPSTLNAEEQSDIGNVFGKVGNAVGDTVSGIGGSVSDAAESISGDADIGEARQEIDTMAAKSLKTLLSKDRSAKILYGKSAGYAVFDSRQMSFMVTTAFGSGVAVDKKTNQRTYMKMASGGVNVGAGAKFYQIVFLFENQAALRNFKNSGWEAGSGASATMGKDSLESEVKFVDGMAFYQITETGVMLGANLSGTKLPYQSDELNQNG